MFVLSQMAPLLLSCGENQNF